MQFKGKGEWKTRPNNPRRPDGVVHEYCPPEQVEPEMRRFLDLYNDGIRHRNYPVNVEAAWLHHRFVRTHPFQDGNGRVSRLLMAWAYVKRSLPPPVVTAQGKLGYIVALRGEPIVGKPQGVFRLHHQPSQWEASKPRSCLLKQALGGQVEPPPTATAGAPSAISTCRL